MSRPNQSGASSYGGGGGGGRDNNPGQYEEACPLCHGRRDANLRSYMHAPHCTMQHQNPVQPQANPPPAPAIAVARPINPIVQPPVPAAALVNPPPPYPHMRIQHPNGRSQNVHVPNALLPFVSQLADVTYPPRPSQAGGYHPQQQQAYAEGSGQQQGVHHVCTVCASRFPDRNTFVTHLRTHNGYTRPFRCRNRACRKNYAIEDERDIHETRHCIFRSAGRRDTQ
ncbi:hypothetical protein EXIGLDRAFT_828357 [Exidia glandulosa HHB12029]|uniref:C2H2-type domain-containing protein n=1 Tax=Exidia glandulosa HHB12029 TaxID=1314781 RepID=A0A165QCW7_EXIGL|nr:hypothetical protein EXIGLDRAFT_828357 [Exidia glandulosa HHB12029]